MPQVAGRLTTIALVVGTWVFGGWVRFGRSCRDFLSPRSPKILESETLDWVIRLRGWCAWMIALWAGGRWYREAEEWVGLFDDAVNSAFETALVLPVIIVISAVALPLTAARGQRLQILRGLREPGRTLGITVAVVAVFIVAVERGPQWFGSATAGISASGDGWALVLALVALVALFGALGVMSAGLLWGVPAVLRHMFRARDAHPAYPAILSLMLCIYSLGMGLIRALDADWQSPFPLWLQVALLVGGPLAVAATSLTELHLLRTRCGVHWREAYWDHG